MSQELVERIQMLENVLEKALSGPYNSGMVLTESDEEGFYRVAVPGGDAIVQGAPEKKFKKGDQVVINPKFIVRSLPEILEIKPPVPEFKAVKWENIAGMKSQINRIKQSVEQPLKNAKIYKEFGFKSINGIVLHGPPGCGKTTIGKAIMGSLGSVDKPGSFVYVKGGEMLHPYVGMAEASIKKLFEQSREYYKKYKTKAVLFIDEAEALLPVRGSGISTDVHNTIVASFLAEMDGEENSPLVILSTNHLRKIDPAVLRDGRIDLDISIQRPTYEDSIEIFEYYLNSAPTNESSTALATYSADLVFSKTELKDKVSGAMIENIVNLSKNVAITRYLKDNGTVKAITKDDLKESMKSLKKEKDEISVFAEIK